MSATPTTAEKWELAAGRASVTGLVSGAALLVLAVAEAHAREPFGRRVSPELVLAIGLAVAVAVVALAAASFARSTFRLVTVLAGAAMVATLIPIGAEVRATEDGVDARDRADTLAKELAALSETADDVVRRPSEAAVAAADTSLRRALPDSSTATPPASCANVEEPATSARLCRITALLDRGLAEPPDPDAMEALEAEARELAVLREGDDLGTRERIRVELFATAITAVRALPDRVRAADEALRTARSSISAMCGMVGKLAGSSTSSGTCPSKESEPTSPPSARQLAIAEAQAELDLARAEQAVAPSEANEAAVAAAEDAHRDAEDLPQEDPPVPVADLVSDAAQDLVAAVPLSGRDPVPVELAALGWALLATAALLLLRWLALANAARGPASVTITKVESVSSTKVESDLLTPAFKRHVLANVREPAALPGATQADGVTDILDTSVTADKLLGSVVKAIRKVFATTATYAIDATHLETTSTTGEAHHEVFVKIVSGRTGALVTSGAVSETSRDLAVRSAGYWAAAAILQRDRTIPSWAAWAGAASQSLATADEARARGTDTIPTSDQVEALRQAAAAAPTSGIVLGLYASALNLHRPVVDAEEVAPDVDLDALEVELRAVLCHPRYPVLRYRLIASLSMVAGALTEPRLMADLPRWRRLSAALSRLEDRTGTPSSGRAWGEVVPIAGAAIDVATLQSNLLSLAEAQQQQAKRAITRRRCLGQSLRRSERSFWLHLVLSRSGRAERRQVEALLTSIGRIVALRTRQASTPDSRPLAPVEIDPARRYRWWQEAYNDACTLALDRGRVVDIGGRDRIDAAVGLLEHALELDDAGELTSTWLTRDPDLADLRDDERFIHLVSATRAAPPDPDVGGAS